MKSILKNFYHKFNKNYQADYLFKKEFSYLKTCRKILDVGCGNGEFIELDRKRIVGIDSNKQSIALCKSKKINATIASATKLPFAASSFDGIHCSHVIEHLTPKEVHEALSEIARVLKKNGIFVISSPLLSKEFYDDLTHVRPYNPTSIERYLVIEGYERTLSNIKYKFKKIDLYWRYRPINLPTRFGYLFSNYLYQFGVHSIEKDAYTLVLQKL